MIETSQVSFIDRLLLRCEFSTRIHITRATGNISRPFYRTEKKWKRYQICKREINNWLNCNMILLFLKLHIVPRYCIKISDIHKHVWNEKASLSSLSYYRIEIFKQYSIEPVAANVFFNTTFIQPWPILPSRCGLEILPAARAIWILILREVENSHLSKNSSDKVHL